MHGEARHLSEHAKLARAAGVEQVLDVRNGDMVRLAPGPAEIIDEAPVGRLFRDGSLLVPSEDGPVRERRSLAFAGIVIVALVRVGTRRDRRPSRRSRSTACRPPTPRAAACVDIVRDAVEGTIASIPRERRKDGELVREAVRRAVRSARGGRVGQAPHRQGAADTRAEAHAEVAERRSLKRARIRRRYDERRSRNHDRTPQPRRHRRAEPRRARRPSIAPRSGAQVSEPRAAARAWRHRGVREAAQHQDRAAGAAGREFADRGIPERNPAGGIHHLCYEVADILAARDQLKAAGARVLGDGEPKIGAHGKPVLFLHPKDFNGTLVELEQA